MVSATQCGAGSAGLVCSIKKNWVSEDVQNVLDEQGASDERMAAMATAEDKTFAVPLKATVDSKTIDASDTAVMEVKARQTAMWLLGNLVKHAALPDTYLLKVGILLDVFCLRRPGALVMDSIPAICAALVKIVKKFDSSAPDAKLHDMLEHARRLIDWLQASVCPAGCDRMTPKQLNHQEEVILATLRWSIDLPTVQDWVTLACTRLNVFMFNMLTPVLTPMWERSFYMARLLAVNSPATAEFSPRQVGQGVLCLNLVSARVLPPAAFELHELAAPSWDNGGGNRAQPFNPQSVELLIQCLEKATNSDRTVLKKNAHFVNKALLGLNCPLDDRIHFAAVTGGNK